MEIRTVRGERVRNAVVHRRRCSFASFRYAVRVTNEGKRQRFLLPPVMQKHTLHRVSVDGKSFFHRN